MQAVVYLDVDDVRARDVAEPALRPGYAIVRNRYVGICGSDTSIVHGKHPRAKPPLVLGHENASVVEAVAKDVAGIEVGRPVVLFPLITCGRCWPCRHGQYQVCHGLKLYGIDADGTMAERQAVPADTLVPLPEAMDLRLAALVEPVAVGVHTVNQADWSIGPGVLVTGAGPIGTLTALVVRHLKGIEPVLVEMDPVRRGMAEAMGFRTIDAARADWVDAAVEATGGEGADVLFEATGAAPVAERMTDLVHARGQILIESIFKEQPAVDLRAVNFKEIEIRAARCYQRADFQTAIDLLVEHPDAFARVITHEYPIAEAPEAFARAEAKGDALKVLVRCD